MRFFFGSGRRRPCEPQTIARDDFKLTQRHVVIYKDAKQEWRWRARAANGRIIGDSSEGYTNKQDMLNSLNILKRPEIPVFEIVKN